MTPTISCAEKSLEAAAELRGATGGICPGEPPAPWCHSRRVRRLWGNVEGAR